MPRPRSLAALALAAACLTAGSSAAAAAQPPPLCSSFVQDDEEPVVEDKRPEIKEACEIFLKHISKRGDEDVEAVAVMDGLLQEFAQSGPKDRKLIADSIGKALDQKRKTLEGDVLDNKLHIAAAVCLGEMAPESTSILTKWIGHKRLRKDTVVQMQLILSLGKSKDVGVIKILLKLLKDKSSSIISAAAQSLGNYSEADLKERKKIVNDLVRLLIDAKTAVDDDVTDTIAREIYDTIAAPIITTLQELTGHDERAPEGWQHWWNKNKKKDWDEED